MAGHLYIIGFDGVLCDTQEEWLQSGWRAANRVWPTVFADKKIEDYADRFRACRPMLQFPNESIVLLRMLVDGRDPEEIQTNFGLAVLKWTWTLKENDLASIAGREALMYVMAQVRDDWIQEDPAGWLGLSRFYPGALDALRFAEAEVIVATGNERRFAQLLLRSQGLELPDERVLELQSGEDRAQAVDRICREREGRAGFVVHLVDDRPETVMDVEDRTRDRRGDPKKEEPDFITQLMALSGANDKRREEGWEECTELLWAEWGYATPAQRAKVEGHRRVKALSLPDFSSKML
eukprot:tig00000093_g3491.t1